MTSGAACVINTLKALAGINDNISIISPIILETIQNLKIRNASGLHQALDIDEILIAMSISAITSPVAELAMNELPHLRGLDCHSSKILREEDIAHLKKLGLAISMENGYENN